MKVVKIVASGEVWRVAAEDVEGKDSANALFLKALVAAGILEVIEIPAEAAKLLNR